MTKESGVPGPERPLSPSNDAIRIASDLASSSSHWPFHEDGGDTTSSNVVRTLAATVEAAIYERALRAAHVPRELLLDPAWDMLLELLHAEVIGRNVTALILCKAAAVPPSSGLRWIDALVARRFCMRSGQADDPSRMIVELSPLGSEALRAYFAEIMGPQP